VSRCKDCGIEIPSRGPRRCRDCLTAQPEKNTRGRAGARWARVRQEVLDRDGHRCTIRIAGCTGRATQVDHVVPIAALGPDDPRRDDPANLRAACRSCNVKRRYLGELPSTTAPPAERLPPWATPEHRPDHNAPTYHGRTSAVYTPCVTRGCHLHHWKRQGPDDEWVALSRPW
jgi:5-methylcytosine-specific restriction protein A